MDSFVLRPKYVISNVCIQLNIDHVIVYRKIFFFLTSIAKSSLLS